MPRGRPLQRDATAHFRQDGLQSGRFDPLQTQRRRALSQRFLEKGGRLSLSGAAAQGDGGAAAAGGERSRPSC